MNRYGLEVTSGIILGLDTDTAESEKRIIEFIDASHVPVLTINLLQALPKTPLWDRLSRSNRIVDDESLESNVRFLRPYDAIVAGWRRCIAHAYTPERLFERFQHQMDATYRHRIKTPLRTRLTRSNLTRGVILGGNILVKIALRSPYRRVFRAAAWQALKRGQIEAIFNMGFVAHHMIRFTQDALAGYQNASFYSTRTTPANDDGDNVNERVRVAQHP